MKRLAMGIFTLSCALIAPVAGLCIVPLGEGESPMNNSEGRLLRAGRQKKHSSRMRPNWKVVSGAQEMERAVRILMLEDRQADADSIQYELPGTTS